MDPERRKWLETALESAFGGQEDPNKLMMKAVGEIKDGKISAGLDYLEYTSDFPDCAENVEKVGALAVLVGLISSDDPLVVRRSLEVLNMYLPNNPRVQLSAALKYECLPAVKSAFERHIEDVEVLHMSLSVMGSLIRNVVPLEASFIRERNVQSLIDYARKTTNMKSLQKIVSIVSSLTDHKAMNELEDDIYSLVQYIYGNHMQKFRPDDIQFWEVASRLSQFGQCRVVCKDLFDIRISWIQALDTDSQSDYSSELEMLGC
jgi:hypothetical protein